MSGMRGRVAFVVAARFSTAAALGACAVMPALASADFPASLSWAVSGSARGNAFGAAAAVAGGGAFSIIDDGAGLLSARGLTCDFAWSRRSPTAPAAREASFAAFSTGGGDASSAGVSCLARDGSLIGSTGTTRGAAVGATAWFGPIGSWPMRHAMPAASTSPAAEPTPTIQRWRRGGLPLCTARAASLRTARSSRRGGSLRGRRR